MMNDYKIEATDTFGGEANYSWVARYTIQANTERGALNKFARIMGRGWRKDWSAGDVTRYTHKRDCVCVFIEQV